MQYKTQEIYNKTIDFAAKAHKNQKVPGKEYSYVVHLVNVAMEVIYAAQNNKDLNEGLMIQCALLHDTIEDAGISYEELVKQFGEAAAQGVQALSKNSDLNKKEAMKDSLNRIKNQPKEVWIVKMADRITNLQTPPIHWNEEKIRKYKEEALLIYKELKEADSYIANRLKWKIENYPE